MEDSDESRRSSPSTKMENLSLQANRFPRDLLQRFLGSSGRRESRFEEEAKEEEEVELNLGLSLGGRFGVDRSSKKLTRSSSVAGYIPIVRDGDAVALPQAAAYSGLVRTSSLPVETEEEWRKRKELQMLRRMEAKRRRLVKQRNSKGDKDSSSVGGGGGGGGSGSAEEEKGEMDLNLIRGSLEKGQSTAGPPSGLSTWAAAARQTVLGGGIDLSMAKEKGIFPGLSRIQGLLQPSPPGSVESQGGSSSNMSELESKPHQGSSSCGEVSPVSIRSRREQSNQETACSTGTNPREATSGTRLTEMENPSKKLNVAASRGREIGTNSIEDMPCVFTKGDGPNGRRIEGILYKYGKGEEVRIMCVCHGSFLSPADFVKHAGGTDVDHPLRHIVVNPNASPFL